MASQRRARAKARDWERWSAATGIVFVVLTVIWALLVDLPDIEDTDQQIAAFYADDDQRNQIAIAGIFLALAGPFLLWFAATLRSHLRRAERQPGRLSAASFGGGVALAALLFVKNALISATGAVWYLDDFETSPDVARTITHAVDWMVWHEALAAAVFVGAASIVALRTGALARWQAWAGIATALLCFLTPIGFGIPLILVLAWILVVSVLLLMRSAAEDEEPPVAAPG